MRVKGYEIPQDLPLILGLLAELIRVEIRIQKQALPDIVTEIQREGQKNSPMSTEWTGVMMDKLWRGCGFWLQRLFRSDRPCLRRSLVLFRWRIRHGLPVLLRIGVDREGEALKGHAWIVTPDGPYREDEEKLGSYLVMLEYEGQAKK